MKLKQNEPSPVILIHLLNWRESSIKSLLSAAERQNQHLRCREILCAILGAYLDCHRRDVQIALQANGKPFLVAPMTKEGPLFFNLAHSGNYLLIALSQVGELGVDLESSDRDFNVVALGQRLGVTGTKAEVLRAFTAREAALKCNGLGLRAFRSPPSDQVCWVTEAEGYALAVAATRHCDLKCLTHDLVWSEYE